MNDILAAALVWYRVPLGVLIIGLTFGLAPGLVLNLMVLIYPKDHPRRRELVSELRTVPYFHRALWVFSAMELTLTDGLPARIRAWKAIRRKAATDDPPWDVAMVDDLLKRRDLHDRVGGSRQSGISSAPRIGSVLLFTAVNGLGQPSEGWEDDGSYSYVGEGSIGDHRLIRGNAAILRDDLTIRMFVSGRGGLVRYLGVFKLDSHRPYMIRQAPDHNGDIRNVLVFKLWPSTADVRKAKRSRL